LKHHHTKEKGDLGVAKVIADLTEQGFVCLLPMSEHQDFDLVAYKQGGQYIRVQVKYRSARNGVITIPFRTCWSDKHGVHTQRTNKAEIDLFAAYCPETKGCYYFKPDIAESVVCLRISPTKNNQSKNVKLADDYKRVP
jgi:hypothetical protein